jgi:hypothetical protein
VPIFWDGDVKIKRGCYVMYEQNAYHTQRWFSLDWGASISYWMTKKDSTPFYAYSVFPAIRLWLFRNERFDMYFTYSVAGPTYLTKVEMDGKDTGEHFTFQDFMGFGIFLGHKKNINISAKVVHYSNGNLFLKNAGISVPVNIGIGIAF